MRILLSFLLLTALFACETAKKEIPEENEVLFREFTLLPFTIYETNGACSSDTARNCTVVNVEYPLVSDSIRASAAEYINKELSRQAANNIQFDTIPYRTIRPLVADFLESYKELQQDFPQAFGWRLNITGVVLRNDPEYLVVKMTSESFTGGAHGNRHVQYTNFNSVTGEILALADVVDNTQLTTLNTRALEAFKTSKGLNPEDDPSEKGYSFPSDYYFNPENFGFVNDSIIFYFNPYEIAPYSDGITEFRVNVADLK